MTARLEFPRIEFRIAEQRYLDGPWQFLTAPGLSTAEAAADVMNKINTRCPGTYRVVQVAHFDRRSVLDARLTRLRTIRRRLVFTAFALVWLFVAWTTINAWVELLTR